MSNQDPLRVLSDAEVNPVPVFSCIVILSVPDESGRRTARVANLAGLNAEGSDERALLTSIMKKFKDAVSGYSEKGEPIPWIDPPETPNQGEAQRFIPVHLRGPYLSQRALC